MDKTHDEARPDGPAFTDECYENRRFSGIACKGSEVHEIEFYQCRFEGCHLGDCSFRQCRFEQCTFEKCDLSVMKPSESRFTEVRFERSKLLGVDWTLAATPATMAFHGCNVGHSLFQRMTLPKLEMMACIAREADFTGTNLAKANFTGTDLLGSRFAETDLTGADFTDAVNYAIDPRTNRVKKAIFSLPEALSLLGAFDIVLK